MEERTSGTVVSYGTVDQFPGWGGAPSFLQSLLSHYGASRVLEIGSGANPTLAPEDLHARGLTYVTSDIDPRELEKADPAFERLVLDLSAPMIDSASLSSFDCIFSRMVAEHVRYGRQYHANIFRLLRPGGISAHCFSTLWTVPFAANRLLPESLAEIALNLFNRRDLHRHGKFPAYYSWSRGPTSAMLRSFQDLGFEVVRYTGYFGHPYYKSVPILDRLESWKSRYLVKHPFPQLCAYATLVLRKPGE